MNRTFSKKVVAKYLRDHKCPACGSDDLDCEELGEFLGNEFSVPMSCNACGAGWWDIYTMVSIDPRER